MPLVAVWEAWVPQSGESTDELSDQGVLLSGFCIFKRPDSALGQNAEAEVVLHAPDGAPGHSTGTGGLRTFVVPQTSGGSSAANGLVENTTFHIVEGAGPLAEVEEVSVALLVKPSMIGFISDIFRLYLAQLSTVLLCVYSRNDPSATGDATSRLAGYDSRELSRHMKFPSWLWHHEFRITTSWALTLDSISSPRYES